ncbi:MAG: DUF2752 domain-containing protein [Lachnospiraceae bacterium]|nr:DUF2752 domain-containing protein [Lachnospiraceae bacterium]
MARMRLLREAPAPADRVLAPAAAASAVLFFAVALLVRRIEALSDLAEWLKELHECPFREFWGIYCPGCGGIRAVEHLARGDLWGSFFFHPAVALSAVFLAAYLLSQLIWHLSCGKVRCLSLSAPLLVWLLAVILLQWFVKLCFLWSGQPLW